MRKPLLLLFLLALLPLTAMAGAVEINGIYYNLVEKAIKIAEVTKNPNQYTGNVVIPEKVDYNGASYNVTSIGDDAFSGCRSLTSVTIPNSVTSIGDRAFYGCSALTSVTIPNSVTSIGDLAFYGCCVTSVTIPNSVTSIGDGAFHGCSVLTSVTIPSSVTSIGDWAFFGCHSLTSVTIPNSVTSIGDWAFSYCSGLTSVTIPNSVTSIGNETFYKCSSLTSVTIPSSVTSIGGNAFRYCSGLTSVTIPSSVTSIGDGAFESCSGLTSVTIPNSVTGIGDGAFAGCSGLTSVTIGSGVKQISNYAFASCSKLTDVTCLAETVPSTSTYSYAFENSYPENMTLHVPAASINSYKTTAPWSQFGKIVSIEGGSEPSTPKCGTPTISGTNPFMGTTSVTLTNTAATGELYYTIDGTEPTSASTKYTGPFTLDHTATVKAIAVDGANRSVVASAVFFKTDHAGTQADPYTAAEAYDMITGGVKLSQDVYVKGIVYSSNNLSSGTITYYITLDGSSTNQVQVYNGKNFDGADFTNTDNVGKGDEVVVKGGFLYYNNTRAEIINSRLVSIVKAPIAVTFGPSGYASLYYSGLNLTVPTGVVASGYKLSTANTLVESVTWTAGEVIPAGTAVLMQAAEGTYDFVVAESASKTDAENILLGTDGNTTPAADANAYFYKFALDNNGQNPGFYWGEATGATFKMSAHKAYLKVAKSAGAKTVYYIGREATGISRLPVDGSATNGPVYNMAGQRVDASYKGLIIRNGKKMIRK